MTTQNASVRPTRGPYQNGIRRREKILDAAMRAFGQRGYEGASLRAIAEMVDATPATIVAYFGSKEGLLVAVLERWREQTSFGTAAYSGLTFLRWLIHLMRFHVEHRGYIELFLTMSAEASQPEHPARPFIVERQREAQDNIVVALRDAVSRGQAPPMSDEAMELEARLIIATLDGIELEWLLHPELDLEGAVRHYMNTVISRLTVSPLADVESETADWLASVG